MKIPRGGKQDHDEANPAIGAGSSSSHDDGEHFEAEEHDDEEHDEHIDEKWLVSYSDMMTLLFGLFVMLYSMAIDKKGNFEEQLKSMATQTFAQTESAIPAAAVAAQPTPSPTPVPIATPRPEIALKEELDKINIEKQAVAQELADLKLQRETQSEKTKASEAALEATKIELAASLAINAKISKLAKAVPLPLPPKPAPDRAPELEKKIAALEKELKIASKKDPTLDKKIASLTEANKKIEESREKLEAANKKLEESRKELLAQNQALEKNVKQTSREIASVDTKTEALDTKLKRSEQQREIAQADLDKVQKKLDETQAKLQRLEKFEEQEKNKKPFLMFVVKWATEKVDVDMVVTDPAGHRFNYKKRKFGGAAGEFTLDSRAGPGAEIWQADGFQPGIYTIEVTLYETYGNDEPAVVELSIASTLKRMKLPAFKLTASGKKTSAFRVNVSDAGEMTLK